MKIVRLMEHFKTKIKKNLDYNNAFNNLKLKTTMTKRKDRH